MAPPVRIDANPDQREDALRFLYGRIDYERALNVPYHEREFKLERMRELLDRLGNPQREMPIVHVGGTKGKGSTAVIIAAVLSAAGRRTGVFTSPHFDRLEERMSVDGQPCPADELVELVDRLRPVVEVMDGEAPQLGPDEIGPTFFELTTAMALLHFARRRLDAAVLEVGLGGRLDSTNVCSPCVAVITSISLDHTQQLGNTLASIAREKAGIIKPGAAVVSAVTQDEPRQVIEAVCRERGCRLTQLGVDFDFTYRPPRHLERAPAAGEFGYHCPAKTGASPSRTDLSLGLLGRHQASNAAVALAVVDELRRQGWAIPEAAIRTGLARAYCPGRVEVVGRRPAVVLDTAHNPASVDALRDVLAASFSAERRLLVFATTQEKDARGMLQRLLGGFDEVIFTRYLENPRAVPPEELQQLAAEVTDRPTVVCATPDEAWDEVRHRAGPADLVCIAGSFYIAAEMRRRIADRTAAIPAKAAAEQPA